VPLHLRLHASYKLRACNDLRCVDSEVVNVTGTLAEAVGYFKASTTDDSDAFGSSVALSGDGTTLAVGAPNEASGAIGIDGDQNDNSVWHAGAVHVFVREGEVWSQQAYVKASNPGSGDSFGLRVALSDDGHTLAVGAHNEASNATGIDGNQNDDSEYAGAVYVFGRVGDTWSQQAYIKASNTDLYDHFGWNVALSGDGNTLVVGAPLESSGIDGDQDDNSADQSGAAYVFVRAGEDWSQQAYIKGSNAEQVRWFGSSVALSDDGNTMAIGAEYEDFNVGAVHVFGRVGGIWSQQAYVKASNPGEFDHFGQSVALSDDGNAMAVGAPREDGDAADAGAVYVFEREGDAWSQTTYVKASNLDAEDHFGVSVALSGDGTSLLVGAHTEDSSASGIDGEQDDDSSVSAGAAYLFLKIDGAWSQKGYVKARNTEGDSAFGDAVGVSDDGFTLAVGASGENSASTGVGVEPMGTAFDSGAVYLY
jgi:hypothetical protein